MCHGDGNIGKLLLQPESRLVDVVDAVVQIINLTATGKLPSDGITDDGIVVLQYIGLHRLAPQGGLLQHRHIPDAGKCHVQRSGNGRCGEGQNVNALCHLLDALLVGHAEALLFVHHQQAKVFETDIFLQNPVGTHQQIHLSGLDLAEGVLLLIFGAEAAHHVHFYRITGKPLHRGEVMLPRQHGGRHQNGGLFARKQAFHDGAEGHFGLAEAHVAAKQAIHGHRALHIPLDLLGAEQLILGLLKGEGLLEGTLPVVVGGKGETGVFLSGGVQLEQLFCQIGGALFSSLLGLLPCRSAQLGQAHGLLFGSADVFAHQIQRGSRDKDEIGACKGDFDIVAPDFVHLNPFHTHKTTDAVVLVHHQIAGMEVGKAFDVVFVGTFAFFAGFSDGLTAFAEENRLEGGIFGTCRQGSGHQTDLFGASLLQIGDAGEIFFAKQLQQILHPGTAAGQQHHGIIHPQIIGQIPQQIVQTTGGSGKLFGGQRDQHLRREGGASQKAVQQQRLAESGLKLPLVQSVARFGGGHKPLFQQMGQILGLPVCHALRAFQYGRGVAADKHRVLGQIGKGGGHFGINLGQVAVGSREITQFSQRIGIGKQGFLQLVSSCLPSCQFAKCGAQTVDATLCKSGESLTNRKNGDGRYRLAPALGQWIKTP